MSRSSRAFFGVLLAGCAGIVSLAAAPSAQAAPLPPGVSADWGTNGRVRAILAVGDRIYIGGSFTSVIDRDGSHPAQNVAAYDETMNRFDLDFDATTNGVVKSLAHANGTLYLGGEFTQVDGTTRRHLGAVNGSNGALTGFRADASAAVDAVLVGSGWLYAGGAFQTISNGGLNYPRPYVAKMSLTTGQPVTSWASNPNGRVRTLGLAADGSVFLGGSFSAVGSAKHNKVAKLSSANGDPIAGFVPEPTAPSGRQPVMSLAVGTGDRLILAVGGSGGACTAMSGADGEQLWSHQGNGDAQAAEIVGTRAWCGGHFGTMAGANRPKLAAFDVNSGKLDSFSVDLNSAHGVWSLEQFGSTVFAGGDFTRASGVRVNRVVGITP
jgi:hypothetical protein